MLYSTNSVPQELEKKRNELELINKAIIESKKELDTIGYSKERKKRKIIFIATFSFIAFSSLIYISFGSIGIILSIFAFFIWGCCWYWFLYRFRFEKYSDSSASLLNWSIWQSEAYAKWMNAHHSQRDIIEKIEKLEAIQEKIFVSKKTCPRCNETIIAETIYEDEDNNVIYMYNCNQCHYEFRENMREGEKNLNIGAKKN